MVFVKHLSRARMQRLPFVHCGVICCFMSVYGQPPFKIRIGTTVASMDTGDYGHSSRQAWYGLQVLEQRVNKDFPPVVTDGQHPERRIELELHVHDDGNLGFLVSAHFTRMIMNNEADVFIAPQKLEFSKIAIEICNEHGKMIFVDQEVMPELFNQGYQYVFAMNILAMDYHNGALTLLRQRGADSVAFSCGNHNPFYLAVCLGAAEKARSLGYSRILVSNRTGKLLTDAAAYINELQIEGPDVLITVDERYIEENLALVARTADFKPHAIVMWNAESALFSDTVGVANTLYLLSPVSWHPDMPHECGLFGTAGEFAALYKEKFNERPTQHAAAAAAAGTALVSLLQQRGIDPNARPEEAWAARIMREVLITTEVQTFFGNLSWSDDGVLQRSHNGVLHRMEGSVVQAKAPPNKSRDIISYEWVGPFDSHSDQDQSVGFVRGQYGSTQILAYPLPPWVTKELVMYPCDSGYVRNYSQEGDWYCGACPMGKSRPPTSLTCLPCGRGTYSPLPALSDCEQCTEGMNCSGDLVAGAPSAQKNWYRIYNEKKTPAYSYWKCNLPHCQGENKCSGHNHGVLCENCDKGYTMQGIFAFGLTYNDASCVKCPASIWSNVAFFSLLVQYSLLVALICWNHQPSIYSLRSVTVVFLKIYVSYLQFHGILLDGAHELLKKMGMLWLTGLSDIMVNPIDSLVSSKCLGDYFGVKPSTAVVLVGLVSIPILLLGSWVCFFLFAVYTVRTRVDFLDEDSRHQQSVVTLFSEALFVTHSVAFGEDFRKVLKEKKTTPHAGRIELSHVLEANAKLSNQVSFKEEKKEQMQEVQRSPTLLSNNSARSVMAASLQRAHEGRIPSPWVTDSMWEFDNDSDSSDDASVTVDMTQTYREHSNHSIVNLDDEKVVARIMSHWVMCSHVVLFVLHVPVLRTLLSAFSCQQFDVLRLASELDIECMGEHYANWFTLTALGVLAHGLAVPLFILHRLCRVRNRLLQINVRRSYGFLYNGYEQSRYFYEVVQMLFKTAMLLALAVPDPTFRHFMQTSVVLIMQGASVFYRPWDDRAYFMFDKLEAISNSALSLAAIASLVWHVLDRTEESGTKEFVSHYYFYLCIFCICVVLHLSFNLFFFQRFIRHNITKYLVMLREYFPERITMKDQVLLSCYSRHLHMLVLEHGQTMNVTALCNEEKQFVKKALFTTLHWYMRVPQGVRKFRPDCLGPAIREAFKRCHRSSRGSVRALLSKDLEYTRCGRLLSHFDDTHIHKRLVRTVAPDKLSEWRDHSEQSRSMRSMPLASRRRFLRTNSVLLNHPKLDELLSIGPERYEKAYFMRKATAEDLQLALMVSWPSIRRGRSRYFTHWTLEARRFWTEFFIAKAMRNPSWEKQESIGIVFDKMRICRKMDKAVKKADDSDDEEDRRQSYEPPSRSPFAHSVESWTVSPEKWQKSSRDIFEDLGLEKIDEGMIPKAKNDNEASQMTADSFHDVGPREARELRHECREFFVWNLSVQAEIRHLRARILCEDPNEAMDRDKLRSFMEKRPEVANLRNNAAEEAQIQADRKKLDLEVERHLKELREAEGSAQPELAEPAQLMVASQSDDSASLASPASPASPTVEVNARAATRGTVPASPATAAMPSSAIEGTSQSASAHASPATGAIEQFSAVQSSNATNNSRQSAAALSSPVTAGPTSDGEAVVLPVAEIDSEMRTKAAAKQRARPHAEPQVLELHDPNVLRPAKGRQPTGSSPDMPLGSLLGDMPLGSLLGGSLLGGSLVASAPSADRQEDPAVTYV